MHAYVGRPLYYSNLISTDEVNPPLNVKLGRPARAEIVEGRDSAHRLSNLRRIYTHGSRARWSAHGLAYMLVPP